MAHFKRKRCKRQVRCTLCTPTKWMGNRKGRWPHRDAKKKNLEDGGIG